MKMTEQETDFDIYENEDDFIKWALENKELILEIRASEMRYGSVMYTLAGMVNMKKDYDEKLLMSALKLSVFQEQHYWQHIY